VALDAVGQVYGDVSAIANANGLSVGMNDRRVIAECVAQRTRIVTGDRRQARLAELVATARDVPVEVLIAN
jgi:hypothetical protein